MHRDDRGRARSQRHRVVRSVPDVGRDPAGDARSRRLLPDQPGRAAVRRERVHGCRRRDLRPACGVAAAGEQVQVDLAPGRDAPRDRDRVHARADRAGGDRGDVEQHAHGGSLRRRVREGAGVGLAVALGGAVPVQLAARARPRAARVSSGGLHRREPARAAAHSPRRRRVRTVRPRRRPSPRATSRSWRPSALRAPSPRRPATRSLRRPTRGRTRRLAGRARRAPTTAARRRPSRTVDRVPVRRPNRGGPTRRG